MSHSVLHFYSWWILPACLCAPFLIMAPMKTWINTECPYDRDNMAAIAALNGNCIKTSILWHSERNMCNSHVIPLFRSLSLLATLAVHSLSLLRPFTHILLRRWLPMHVVICIQQRFDVTKHNFHCFCLAVSPSIAVERIVHSSKRIRVWTLDLHLVNSTSFRHFTVNILHKQTRSHSGW